MRVVRVDDDLAVCEDADGDVRTVEIALVDAWPGTGCWSTPTWRW